MSMLILSLSVRVSQRSLQPFSQSAAEIIKSFIPQSTEMRCHYEVLQLERDAKIDEIKRARDRLARQFHPDKAYHLSDPAVVEEFTATFRLIQQAYEVLSDPHERAWYDSHREQILTSKDTAEQNVDIFSYFNTACYSGYGDDGKGFYAVYQRIFDEISLEDRRYAKEAKEELEIPLFGTSASSYEELVNPFYGFWLSYSTKRPFYSLDKWDLRQAENRRTSRAMEKENKKLRDAKKKEWNESVRELAAFVRKRDPRVKAYRQLLQEKAEENQRKVKEVQEIQRLQRQELLAAHKRPDLLDLEKKYRELERGFGSASDAESEVEEIIVEDDVIVEDDDPLYCITCEKRFKSFPAMRNHIKSNLHRKNMSYLKEELEQDQSELSELADEVDDLKLGDTGKVEVDTTLDPAENSDKLLETAASDKNDRLDLSSKSISREDEIEQTEESAEGRKVKFSSATVRTYDEPEPSDNTVEIELDEYQSRSKSKKEKKGKKDQQKTADLGLRCGVCKQTFSTRNKLFQHIKDEGHAVYK